MKYPGSDNNIYIGSFETPSGERAHPPALLTQFKGPYPQIDPNTIITPMIPSRGCLLITNLYKSFNFLVVR